MRIDITVADAAVRALAALGFQTNLTAIFAKQQAGGFAAFADVAVVEAVAAVFAEVELVVAVFDTDGRGFYALGIPLAAIKAKLTVFAHLHLAVGITAVGAEMVVPVGILDAVFPAGAALAGRIVLTAEDAQAAIVAQLNAVFVQTFLALLTDDAAFLAVKIIERADVVGSVAVAALVAVHQLDLPAALTEATAVAKTAHAVCAEPALTAQLLLGIYVTFTASHTVPAITNVALLAGHAIQAKNSFLKAGTALIAVSCDEALGIIILNTAGAAHTAAPAVVMVVVAVPAFHTVLVVRMDLSGQKAPEHHET